jgi:hypothetical protein
MAALPNIAGPSHQMPVDIDNAAVNPIKNTDRIDQPSILLANIVLLIESLPTNLFYAEVITL